MFGIIIDTFGDLRAKEKEKVDDMRELCFICNLERAEFDRHGAGFANHIRNDHNVRHWLGGLSQLHSNCPGCW